MKLFASILLAAATACLGCVDIEPEPTGWSFGEEGQAPTEPAPQACEEPCGTVPDPPPQTRPEPPPEPPPEPTPEPPPRADIAALSGAFVSGHLGMYDSCPEEGLPSPGADGSGISDDSLCAETGEGPGCGLAACEHGQLMLQLSSVGELTAHGVQVETLELYDGDGELRAVLPILSVTDLDTSADYVGEMPSGEDDMVRITFRGPANAYEYLAPLDGDSDGFIGYRGVIEITVDGSNTAPIIVESTDLYPIPQVDT